MPFIADWRVTGPGQELAAGQQMVADLRETLGAEGIEWLLMDGAYVDGAWLAELQHQGIGVMVRVRADMDIFAQMRDLARHREFQFEPYEYVRTVQGHKELHTVELALLPDLTRWDSYRQACPGLGGLLVRETRRDEDGEPQEITWGLVFTLPIGSRVAAFERYRQRWDVENQGFRELNQGGWLESQTWGRSRAARHTSVALKIGAHNCYCLMRTDLGAQWAVTGLRSLQQQLYGSQPHFLVVVGDAYALFTAEELVLQLGVEIGTLLDLSLREPSGRSGPLADEKLRAGDQRH